MKAELIVPILYSTDVERSIKYYRDFLGFESDWTWEDHPTFGGVNWGDVAIYFCKEGAPRHLDLHKCRQCGRVL